ncbi:hypothetical protein [Natronorubrum texcoconense]|uniref:Zinc-ribbon domain-containing protein n=1 Tax=Natronorubrum texcoconense TaxID=1095776 RepID=A0A1G9FUE7_9EURY|nr:hypothetical protein [Natronorubrum texcoconense]SDK91987.1 hypothetical protein SAMN04515672_4289 [Natronorubrum texcoconense]
MSLSRLLSGLFADSEPSTESPATTQNSGEPEESTTVVHECRNCGTNVSEETTCCPACESEDIVRYSI